VVEAGTANSAFAKGGRCPTVRQPLSTWAPALHRTDEPLVLCQPFLIALIGRQQPLSTPTPENFSYPSLQAGMTLTGTAESLSGGVGQRGLQEGELRIWRAVAARLAIHRGGSGERPFLDLKIGVQIDSARAANPPPLRCCDESGHRSHLSPGMGLIFGSSASGRALGFGCASRSSRGSRHLPRSTGWCRSSPWAYCSWPERSPTSDSALPRFPTCDLCTPASGESRCADGRRARAVDATVSGGENRSAHPTVGGRACRGS